MLKLCAALMPLVLAFGCATMQTMSEAQRKTIRSVSVDKAVTMPPYAVIGGRSTQKAGFFGGPLLMVATMNAQNPDNLEFQKYVADQKIDVADIIRQQFIAEVTAIQAFAAVLPEGGDARFALTVEGYGLAQGFSMNPTNAPVRPTLRLTAKLTAADGTLLWQNTEYITNMSGEIPTYPVDSYYSTPGRLEGAFKQAAQIVVKQLLKELGPAS